MGTATVRRRGAPATAPAENTENEERIVEVQDSKGRVFKLKEPSPIAQYRLAKILGPELASNSAYMMMVMPLLYVVAIDGEPVAFPQGERQVEALVMKVGKSGINLLGTALREHFGEEDFSSQKDDLKN